MSRAYRIKLKESAVRKLDGGDEIACDLGVLEILPRERMKGLLTDELVKRGFIEQPDGTLKRVDGKATLTIDAAGGEIRVRWDESREETIEVEGEATGYDDSGPGSTELTERLKKSLAADLERKAEKAGEDLRRNASEKLERKLCDLQPELADAVNKVTREALKEKARQLGSIKDMHEDEASGELTIRVEV